MIPHGYHPNLGRSHCLSRGAPRMHFVLLLSRYRLNDFSITYSVFLMHRRTDLWGPDGKKLSLYMNFDSLGRRALALEFDPDRWLDERVKKYLIPNPFIFLPFNAGPRICLGQQVRYSPCCSLPPVISCPSRTIVRIQRNVFHAHPFTAKLFCNHIITRVARSGLAPTCLVG